MLLKIRVKKDPTKGTKEIKETSIMGITNEVYQFNGMCDYNYTTIQKHKGKTDCMYSDLVPTGVLDSNYLEERPSLPLFLPPPVFTRIDQPQSGLFKKDGATVAGDGIAGTSGEVIQGGSDENVIGVSRRSRQSYAICVPFSMTDDVPKKPNKLAFETVSLKFIKQEIIDAVKLAFETRPVWTRIGLIESTKVSPENVKAILPIVAFYYTIGPWRTCWVKFGYNPRQDFESRYYQPLDYRVRNATGVKRELISRKKMTKATKALSEGSQSIFEETTIPTVKLSFYQYCDVHLKEIQDKLKDMPGPECGVSCDEKRGWLPNGFQDSCREILCEIVKNNYRAIFQKDMEIDASMDVGDENEYDEGEGDDVNEFLEMDVS